MSDLFKVPVTQILALRHAGLTPERKPVPRGTPVRDSSKRYRVHKGTPGAIAEEDLSAKWYARSQRQARPALREQRRGPDHAGGAAQEVGTAQGRCRRRLRGTS